MRSAYIPALGHDFWTPAYDLAIRLTLPERRFKQRLLDAASIGEGMVVVDVGCGTGTLLLMGKAQHSATLFVGIDPDPLIMRRARRKLIRAQADAQLLLAAAALLPFASASVDRILSTLTFHHLDLESKVEALEESYRVLRPGGEIHIGDFGAPTGRITRAISFLVELIGREHVHEEFHGLLPRMVVEAGFDDVEETGIFVTVFGVLRLVRGVKPV
ncbi:MAG TPA: methyltransferase domain-containing protein [Thermoanaerobaculia bacterium]|jgi:ubiquinone/menaquinone biosynthesis C-methylase UbiE